MNNFGQIKTNFNTLVGSNIKSNDTEYTKIFKKYIKLLKENESLRKQFDIFVTLESKYEPDLAKAYTYVNEFFNMVSKPSKDKIISENNNLSVILPENIEVEINEDKLSLYESIHNLLTIKDDINNIDTLIESKNKIVNYISNNKPTDKSEVLGLPNSVVLELFINKFNEKYSTVSEDVKRFINPIIENNINEQSELFKTLVNECVTLVNNNLTESTIELKEKLLQVKETLLNKTFNESTFLDDINKLIELKENLKK